MARQMIAGIAPGIVLTSGYVVNLIAVDPTTGAAVGGVVVSNVSMQVDAAEFGPEPTPIEVLPPLLVHEPQT